MGIEDVEKAMEPMFSTAKDEERPRNGIHRDGELYRQAGGTVGDRQGNHCDHDQISGCCKWHIRYEPVAKEDTYRLIEEAQNGDRRARELVVTQNIGLVKKLSDEVCVRLL